MADGFDGLPHYDAFGELDGAAGIALPFLTLTGDTDSAWLRLYALEPLHS
ncbi:MAG: hypothetical protein ABI346_02225 [Candidatus Baltobacteraceae bacterium]